MFRLENDFRLILEKKYEDRPVKSNITGKRLKYSKPNLSDSIHDYIHDKDKLSKLNPELYKRYAYRDKYSGYKKDNLYRVFNTNDPNWNPSRDLIDLLCYYAYDKPYEACVKEGLMKNNLEQFYLLKTERDSTEKEQQAIFTKPEDKRMKDNRGGIITTLGILLLALFIFGLLFYRQIITEYLQPNNNNSPSITPFDTSKGSYNVLLFPFQPLQKCQYKKTDIENAIITRLLDMNYKDSLNIQIKLDTIDCIHSYEEADSIGKKLFAHLVIWGDLYEQCNKDTTQACLKYLVVKTAVPKIEKIGESGIEYIASMAEITKGKLQKEIDYIIYWIAGSRAFFRNTYSTALQHFKTIEHSYTTSDVLFLNMGICYYNMESWDSAKINFEKALMINPDLDQAHVLYAMVLGDRLNNKIEAKKHYEMALKINPDDDNTHTLYGLFLKRSNEISEAKNHYETALRINPNNADAHNCYAAILISRFNDKEGAKKHLEFALKINSNDANLHTNYAVLLRNKFNDIEGAREHYEIALKINPDDADLHVIYAYLLKDRFNNIEGTKKHLEFALQIDSNDDKTHARYASILQENFNDIEGAKKHYEIALRINQNDVTTHFNYAQLLQFKLNDFKNAKKHYEKILKISSDFTGVHTRYAILLQDNFNDIPKAKKHYEMAIRIDSNDALAHNNYARLLYFKLGDKVSAKKHYLKATELNPQHISQQIDQVFNIRR